MQLKDIIAQVQALHDDEEGTYVTPELVASHAQLQYQKLYNKLYLSDSQFDEDVIEITGVPAGTPDLSAFLKSGQPLEFLVTPRIVEWKLPGLDDTNYRVAAGPLDAVRDVSDGMPSLDSWAWIRRNLKLSKFATALDLRITCTTMFDALTDPDSVIQIDNFATVALAYLIALAIAQSRNMPNMVKEYRQEADDAFDDLMIAKVKGDQSRTRRLGRISRRVTERFQSFAAGSVLPSTDALVTQYFHTSQNFAVPDGIVYWAVVEGTGGAGGIDVSIPPAANCLGKKITVQKMDASALGRVRCLPQGGDLFNGDAEYDLVNLNQFVTFESDGIVWLITASN
jgi:hypothetical protein